MPPVPQADSPVGSVDRALLVLELLGKSGVGFTLEELARSARLPKSSLHRTLGALKHRGFAAQDPGSGRYFLGTALLRTAFGFYERMDLPSLIHPLLVRLRDEFNETVHLAVLDGADVVYLDKVDSSHSVRMTSVIGGRNPAYCTGVGKALVASTHRTDKEVRAWVKRHGPFRRRTPHTLTSESELVREMTRIRERAYSLDLEENEIGVRCIAVPVFLGHALPAGAVSLAAPKERLTDARMRELAPRLRSLADRALTPEAAPVASSRKRERESRTRA